MSKGGVESRHSVGLMGSHHQLMVLRPCWDRGLVDPIEAEEQVGFAEEIGNIVLTTHCRQRREHQKSPRAINIEQIR